MIINYPTGSYNTVLPARPSDSESVVYTISSTKPPRTSLNVIQIPMGIVAKQHVKRDLPDTLRRSNLGVLALTTKENRPGVTGTGNQLFYAGQILEFTDSSAVEIANINSSLETEHDQHYIDPDSVGLEQSELDDVSANAFVVQRQILSELEALQKRKDDLEAEVVTQQKVLNEANRVIAGVDVILENDPDNQEMKNVKARMQAVVTTATAAIDEIVAELNTLPAAIRVKHNSLRSLATLID